MSGTRGGDRRGLITGLRAAFAFYAALSLLLFGRRIVTRPTERIVGDDGADKTLYLWSLEWWPRALLGGRNPLDVDAAWAPHGFDFGLGTAGGGLALAAAPLTAVLGLVATYNVLALIAPAASATTAFALARRVTGATAPALVAGYIFGFSSYVHGHLLGHLPLAFVALLPLAPYAVLRRHAGDLSRRTFVLVLAALLTGQFLVVPQVAFSLLLIGLVAAGAAAAALGTDSVRPLAAEATAALAVTLVLLSPLLAYAAVSDAAAPARSPFAESADVLNYVVPTARTWLRPPGADLVADRFTGTGAEQGAYLGLPLLVLVALGARGARTSPGRRVLVLTLLGAVLLSFGTRIKVAGEVVGVGPWAAIAPLPVAGSALPARLTVYTALLAGILVALALADRGGRARWVLALVGAVALLPNVQLPRWASDVPRPTFFARGHHDRHLHAGATALVLPYGPAGWSMLWQAETGFRFRLVGGHFGVRVTPAERAWEDVYENLGSGRIAPGRLRTFLESHGADVVILAPGTRPRARRVVEKALAAPPARIADVLLWRVAATPAAVEQPSPRLPDRARGRGRRPVHLAERGVHEAVRRHREVAEPDRE